MSDDGTLRDRYIGICAVNNMIGSSSASRISMAVNQVGQKVTQQQPEPRIVASPIDMELGATTFSITAPVDLRVLAIIQNNTGTSSSTLDDAPMDSSVAVEYMVIYEDIETNEIGGIEVPRFHSLDSRLGFTYIQMQNLSQGMVLDKGDVIASTPGAVTEEYRYTSVLNVCFCSDVATAEDAVLLNEDTFGNAANGMKMVYDAFVTYTIKVFENQSLLNHWGDDTRVQVVPLVGQKIPDNGILAVKREFTTDNFISQGTPLQMRKIDHINDKVYQCSTDGDSEIVAVRVLRNDRVKPINPDNAYEHQLNRLANETSGFAKQVVNEYVRQRARSKASGNSGDPTPYFNSMLLSYVTQFGWEKGKITPPKLIDKKTDIAPYTIELTVRERRYPLMGAKLTDMYASKGVVSRIVPASRMPRDHYGRVADIAKSPDSIVGRNIPGEVHDQYIGNCADLLTRKLLADFGIWSVESQLNGGTKPRGKRVRKAIRQMLTTQEGTDLFVAGLWEIAEMMRIIYLTDDRIPLIDALVHYQQNNDQEAKADLIKYMEDSLTYRVQVIYANDLVAEIGIVNIIQALRNSKFAPEVGPVSFINESGELRVTPDPIMIAPMSIMALEKDGSASSAAPSVRLQSMRMTSSNSKTDKQTAPLPETNVSFAALDNTVVLSAIIGEKGLGTMLDMFNNVEARQERAHQILCSDTPMGEEEMVDRSTMPYNTVALSQLQHTLAAFGAELIYVDE